MHTLPPIAVLDTDDTNEASSEAKSSSEPSDTQLGNDATHTATHKPQFSRTGSDSKKMSIAAKIKRGSFRMSKRLHQVSLNIS